MVSQITEYIEAGIKKEAAKIADNYKEQIVKDVEDAVSDIVAKLAVRITRFVSFQDLRDQIVISVQKDFAAPKENKENSDEK